MKSIITAAIIGVALHAGTSLASDAAEGNVEQKAVYISVSVFTLDPSEGTDPAEVYAEVSSGFHPATEGGSFQTAYLQTSDLDMKDVLGEFGDGELVAASRGYAVGTPYATVGYASQPNSSETKTFEASYYTSDQEDEGHITAAALPIFGEDGDFSLDVLFSISEGQSSGSSVRQTRNMEKGATLVLAGQAPTGGDEAQDNRLVFVTFTPDEV